MNNMRIIRVTGKGQIKIKPDMIRITMTLEGSDPEYGEVLKKSSQDTDCLKDVLVAFGFERSDLKTLSFKVDTEYENYKEQGVYKQRFIGYKFRHLLKVEYDREDERLGKILYALAHCLVMPELRISYTVKDSEAAKKELLGKAVADAKEKAAILANAAGVTLKDIQNIDYSWGEIDLEVRPMSNMAREGSYLMEDACVYGASYDLDIEPDDIEVSDTVTVVWEIQ